MITPRRPWSGWLDGGHLSLDAVVALVDGELADGPTQRALAHVDHCPGCAGEVAAQRQARRRLRGADVPGAPTSLLSSLRAIPDSAALPPVPGTLAVDAEGRFVVREADDPDDEPDDPGPGAPPAGTGSARDTHGTVSGKDDDGPHRARLSRRTRRRLSVGLPVAVASGLALGAVTLATPAAPPAAPSATPRPVVVPRGASSPAELGAQLSVHNDRALDRLDPGQR